MRISSKPGALSPIQLIFVAGLAVASSSPAYAGASWQCAAPNGSYDELPVPISPGVRTLSGRIQFNRGEHGERWNPKAVVAFTDSGNVADSGCFCNGIRASIHPAEPNTVKFFVIANGREMGMAQGPVGVPISFRVSIDGQGMMTAVVGKSNPRVKTFKLAHPRRDTVHMSCSSGDVSFLNVDAH